MFELNVSGQPVGWAHRPLCRHYRVALFESLWCQVRKGDSAHDLCVRWALGADTEGRCDVLGFWLPASPVPEETWHLILKDLALRGVDRIQLLFAVDCQVALAASRPAKTLAPEIEQVLPGIRQVAVPPRLRRSHDAVKLAADLMQAELIRLVGRRGSFDSLASAVDFLGNTLQRMDRRFWTVRPKSARAAPRRRPIAASGLAAA